MERAIPMQVLMLVSIVAAGFFLEIHYKGYLKQCKEGMVKPHFVPFLALVVAYYAYRLAIVMQKIFHKREKKHYGKKV